MIAEKEISTWARALLAIIEKGEEKKQKEAFEKLIVILKKKKKIYLFHRILKRVKDAYIKKHRVEVLLAREHDQVTEKKIKNSLSKLAVNQKNIEIRVDKGLIGGFRIKTDNFLIKASVRDFLTELKNNYLSSN
jgi:F0F1-type ATP synthase delta subunit